MLSSARRVVFPADNGDSVIEAPSEISRLTAIIECSEDAIISKDLRGTILTWNRGAAAVYGYTAEEAIGQSINLLVPAERHAEEENILERIRMGQRVQHFETVRLKKGGTPIQVSLTISPIREGDQVVGASHVARDISERMRLESANAQLAAIVASSEDAIISKDLSGTILTWNASAERIYGYAADEVIGRSISILLPDSRVDEELETLAKLRRGERIEHFETTRLRKDGQLIDVSLSVSPIRDVTGLVVGAAHIARDITDRKRLEQQLRQAQRLKSVGVLAGGIAHDFNNLLTGIIGNASLIADTPLLAGPEQGYLQDLMVAAQRAAELTKQLLAYAGKGQFVIRPLNLSALVSDILALVKTSIPKTVAVHVDLEDDVPMIEADQSQIMQLLMNMMINGAEAIGEDRSGTVLVRTRTQQIDQNYIRVHCPGTELKPGEYVCLEVRDDGCGMDEPTKARIFEPFFSTKFTGRGLGLAAALGIVNGHKGAIVVSSSPGVGSTFRVMFPALKPSVASSRGASTGACKGTLLVIDDEHIVRKVAKAMLELHGYSVLLAGSGEEAVELFREMQETISLVILDLTMPAMGGQEALQHIRAIRADVPVVLSSGYREADAMSKFANDSLAGFVQKPYTSTDLYEKVDAALAAGSTRNTNSFTPQS